MKHIFEMAIAHSYWANINCLDSLLDPADFKNAHALLCHIAATETIYLQRIRSEDPFPQDFWPNFSPDHLRDEIEQNKQHYNEFLSKITEPDFVQMVRYRNSAGTYYENPVFQMLEHVFMHSSHHRGQICLILRSSGRQPPALDLITFTRL